MTKHIDLDDDIVKKNWESGEAWLDRNKEEIREGIASVIRVNKDAFVRCVNDKLAEELIYWITDKIRHNLHSQGVVIKAERELPPSPYVDNCPEDLGFNHCRNQVGEAGYVAVESLIKEEKK